MGAKGLIRLLLVLVVAGGLAAIAHFVGSETGVDTVESKATNKRARVFSDFPADDIKAITIQDKEATLDLQKIESGWVVVNRENYPANADRIRDLLRQMWDIKITQVVPNGGAHLARLELTPPADAKGEAPVATVLNFKDGEGKELTSLSLGKILETNDGPNPYTGQASTSATGRYVQPGGKSSVYLIDTPLQEAADTTPFAWMAPDFFKIEDIKSISVERGTPKEDWSLDRKTPRDKFELAGIEEGRELDPTKVTFAKSAFLNPTFEDIYVGEKPKTDSATWMIATFDGFTYTVSVGEKDEENNRPLTFAVEAKLKEKRDPVPDETPEQKESRDADFAGIKEDLAETFAEQQTMAKDRVFQIRSAIVDSYLVNRDELLAPLPEPETPGVEIPRLGPEPEVEAPPAGAGGLPPGFQLPEGFQLPGQ